ncbi:substrate-binding domain-containing protein [Butyrivibrio sp. MC2013]|uniref:substrate-binding domain-containing protein n=1 Tax=Butyrivibrio sp. MC2013 TaxID=1280686 RepID=UPI00040906AD|nr:sugar-binding protein [Butyrivibrio sp. MC2013]
MLKRTLKSKVENRIKKSCFRQCHWSSLSFCTILMSVILLSGGCSAVIPGSLGSQEEASKEMRDTVHVPDHLNDGRNVIGISMPDSTLERWNKDGIFLNSLFTKEGYEVILYTGDNLIDTQQSNIETMIEQGADVLLIAAVDGNSLTGVLEEAHDAGVKVVAYDRLIMKSDAISGYISYDNYAVGKYQGEFIKDKLLLDEVSSSEPKYLEIVSGDPSDNNAFYFYNGAMDVLKPYIESGSLKVASGQMSFYETCTGQWSSDTAFKRFAGILSSYYPKRQLDAVLCANDSTAYGAIMALRENYRGQNKVLVTGQDADQKNREFIESGEQSMTVYKNLTNETMTAFYYVDALLKGEALGQEFASDKELDFDIRFDNISYDNGKGSVDSYLLSPMVITKDNLDSLPD